MTTNILYNEQARNKMYSGVQKLNDAVKVTLGPKGRFVAIRSLSGKDTRTTMTKDGVTVAKTINLPDKMEDMGAQIVKEAAIKTAELAGDGTTTATILAEVIIREGLEAIKDGANPMDLKRGMDKAVKAVVAHLSTVSTPIGDNFELIRSVANISANNDQSIADLITEAMEKTGVKGYIGMQETPSCETTVELVEGIHIERGFVSPYFINVPGRNIVEFKDALILLYDKKISFLSDIQQYLEYALRAKAPLVILCEDIEGEALSTMVTNSHLKTFAAVKIPGYGDERQDLMEDLAILTGGHLISDQKGNKLSEAKPEYLGRASMITITQTSTAILGAKGDKKKIADRITHIDSQIELQPDIFIKEKLKVRRAKVSGSIAIMHIGGYTDVERVERKFRIDDALRATKAAVEEGIVPGGGTFYLKAFDRVLQVVGENDDENTGIQIIAAALAQPITQICLNAGLEDYTTVINTVRTNEDPNFGYNAQTDVYEDLLASGVIDPAKVVRVALEHACSVSSMFLLTECAISDY